MGSVLRNFIHENFSYENFQIYGICMYVCVFEGGLYDYIHNVLEINFPSLTLGALPVSVFAELFPGDIWCCIE